MRRVLKGPAGPGASRPYGPISGARGVPTLRRVGMGFWGLRRWSAEKKERLYLGPGIRKGFIQKKS